MRVFGRDLSQPKGYFLGTHRACSPAETLRALQPLLSRVGITRLANVTGLDRIGIPVYLAVRPNARSLNVSQGKGLDPDSAKVSALMESIEAWHAEGFVRPLRHESYALISRSLPVVDVEALPRWAGGMLRLEVPMLWMEGQDLMTGEPVWVPHEMVCLNWVCPPDAAVFTRGSNGLASGNHLLEALVHGICEVIERDAASLWHQTRDENDDDARLVDLATVIDATCRATLDRLRQADIGVAVWDITSDVEVPAYAAAVFDRPGLWVQGIFCGYGCHLSPGVALARALSEAVQSRLTYIAGNRDDIQTWEYAELRSEDALVQMWDHVAPGRARRSFAARPALATATFEDDVRLLLERLRAVGIASAVAVDLTEPDIGIPVVKVIVPGLEEMVGERYVPGRRARALSEAGPS